MRDENRNQKMRLSPGYAEAVAFALECHDQHWRKGTDVPYLSHLLAVSSLVLEYGGTETEAIAGLLHDVLEDVDGGIGEEISARFGAEVLGIVVQCSDSIKGDASPKPPWRERKTRYLGELPNKTPSALLVTACDKLHNLTAIARDFRSHDDGLWDRFNGSKEDIQWYYERLTFELLGAEVAPARDLALRLGELGWIPREGK